MFRNLSESQVSKIKECLLPILEELLKNELSNNNDVTKGFKRAWLLSEIETLGLQRLVQLYNEDVVNLVVQRAVHINDQQLEEAREVADEIIGWNTFLNEMTLGEKLLAIKKNIDNLTTVITNAEDKRRVSLKEKDVPVLVDVYELVNDIVTCAFKDEEGCAFGASCEMNCSIDGIDNNVKVKRSTFDPQYEYESNYDFPNVNDESE